MNNRVGKISRMAAVYSLFGYFLSTTFSHALTQHLVGLVILFVIINLIAEKKFTFKPQIDSFGLFVMLFVIWSIISALAGATPLNSLLSLREEWLFMMIPATAYLCRDERVVRICLKLFAISAVIICLYAIFQHFTGIDPIHNRPLLEGGYGYRVRGFFTHRMTFGNYYTIISFLFLCLALYSSRKVNKAMFYSASALSAAASILTFSRGSVLALVAGIVIFLFWYGRRHWKLSLFILIILLVVGGITMPGIKNRFEITFKYEMMGEHGNTRMEIWRTSAKMALAHPVFGVGQGNFADNYAEFRGPRNKRIQGHGHNDLLNIAAYAGFPAALFFLGFWVSILYKCIWLLLKYKERNYARGAISGLLLASLVFLSTSIYEATFADEEVRLLLMALWGILLGISQCVKTTEEKTE